MSRKPSIKKMEIALQQAGYLQEEDKSWEITGDYYDTPQAYNKVFNADDSVLEPRREAVRTPHNVEETVLGIAQYMSTNYKIMARWGDNEVNLKNLIAAVVSAYEADSYQTVTDSMVKNTVNKWKRQGIVEQTKKGYFRSSETSRVDWSQFKR